MVLLLLLLLLAAGPAAAEPEPASGLVEQTTLEQIGEVNPGYAPQKPLDLERYWEALPEALWLRAGGYLQAEFSGDFGAPGNPFGLTPSRLGEESSQARVGSLALGQDARLNFRRTRVFVDAYSSFPEELDGLRGYAEVDFSGLRHLYVQTRYLVVGRTNSAFKDPGAEPESVDSVGPNAKLGLRQQGLRLVLPLEGDELSLAVEDPGPGVAPDGSQYSDDGLVRKFDFAAHYRHQEDWGHLQFSAIRRDLSVRSPGFSNASFSGWGAAASGQILIDDRDHLQFELGGGPGLGRYLNDLAGTRSELGLKANGETGVQWAWGGYLAYQHWLSERTRLNLQAGYVGVNLLDGQPADSLRSSCKASINLVQDLDEHLRLGLEYGHGWRWSKDGQLQSGGRLTFLVRYGF